MLADAVVVHVGERGIGLLFQDVDDASLPHLRELILLFADDDLPKVD